MLRSRGARHQCEGCGYLHPVDDGVNVPTPVSAAARSCHAHLSTTSSDAERLDAKRRDRITSDEEERCAWRYEIRTGVRFAVREGSRREETRGLVGRDGESLADLEYGHAATLWRINVGWRRRDRETGEPRLQCSTPSADTGRGPRDQRRRCRATRPPTRATKQQRVVPYVEDHQELPPVTPRAPPTRPFAEIAWLRSRRRSST